MKKYYHILILTVCIAFFGSVSADVMAQRTRLPARGVVAPVMSPIYPSTTPPRPGTYTSYSYNSQTGVGYYYSEGYQPGYVYASTPRPGYYYYFRSHALSHAQVVPSPIYGQYTPPHTYHQPQNYTPGTAGVQTYHQGQYYYPNNYPLTTVASAYPGCDRANIIIGGQEWASCNASDRSRSSRDQSGWFFAGDTQSTFLSYNGMGNTLAWQGKQGRTQSYTQGPCAQGYRLPTRGEWETAIWYARQNTVTLAQLLGLPYNGGFYGYRDTAGNVTLAARSDINGAYWSSTTDGATPIVLHLGSPHAGYRTDGTGLSRVSVSDRWQYSDTGLNLVRSQYSELANVRCIKN